MERILRIVTRHAGLVVAVVLALTVFWASRIVDFATGETHLSLDPSVNRLLPDGSEDRAFYERVRLQFGSDETLLVALVADDIFQAEHLGAVMRITRRIEALKGVHHVVSLSTALNIRDVGGDLEIEPFLTEIPTTREELRRVREEALGNPVYAGNLVSADARATALLVYFLDVDEATLTVLDGQIQEITGEEKGSAEVRITGSPHIKVATSETIVADLSRIIPLALLVLALVALLSFRTARGVILPISSIVISMIWTLGIIAWLGLSLNLVTAIVPPLILTIGFAYVIHVLTEHEHVLSSREPGDEQGAVHEALAEVALPIMLTALTTAAGFMSMTLSNIGAIREVGLFSSLGVVITSFIALSFVPAMLELLPVPRRLRASRGGGVGDRVLETLARFDIRHRTPILVVTGVVAIVSVVSIAWIEVNNGLISGFDPDSRVRRDFEAVNLELGGSNPIYIILETDYADAFKEPVNLETVQALQEWLEARPEIGVTTSLVDYLKLINKGFHGNDPAYLAIPETRRLATQLLFFGASEEIENFVDSRYQNLSILVRSKVVDSRALAGLVGEIEAHLEGLPEHLEATVTGNTVLVAKTSDDIARGQALSLGVAFVMIYIILSLLFTSLRMGFFALLPNAVPVAIYFGAIVLSGTQLNTTNGLVACIVLGIAVDDTIHYLARFGVEAKRKADTLTATIATLRTVGRPVAYTSLALSLGFLVMTSANLKNWVEFGALGGFTLAIAWLVDVTFTPAMASGLRIVTLWDVLSLDLGEDPQRSIPIFKGLTARQARVVALTARIEEFSKGTRLFKLGDEGGVMYVVIDGKLSASVDRNGGRVEFATHTRGDVVGEVGLFGGQRTADVDVVSDARLLRITESALERLQRRSPRIAARLLANLNRIVSLRAARSVTKLR